MTWRPRSADTGPAVRRTLLLLATPLALLSAQSAQPYAVQVSALFTMIQAGNTRVAGSGVEVQQRFNRVYATETFGALSLGVGAQFTVHTKGRDRLEIRGLFAEPRWVPPLATETVFPYVSMRLSLQQMLGEFQFAENGRSLGGAMGVGGGVAVRLARKINLDAGAQLLRQQFGNIGVLTFRPFTTYNARVGVSLGYPR
jgi:hypothetical protein